MSSDEEYIPSSPEDLYPKEGVRKSKRIKASSSSVPPAEGRHVKRVVRSNSDKICPICHLTLRNGDLDAHFQYELEKLSKYGANKGALHIQDTRFHEEKEEEENSFNKISEETVSDKFSSSTVSSVSTASSSSADVVESQPGTSGLSKYQMKKMKKFKEPGHESFRRVRMNRVLREQSLKWKARGIPDETICPVCEEIVLVETPEELHIHADKCLKKQEGHDSTAEEEEEEEDLIEGDEYEWCGMKRVRVTSLLKSQGRLDALGTMVKKGDEDEDVEVCWLPEEDEKFGPSQYFQKDLEIISNGDLAEGKLNNDDRHHSPIPSLLKNNTKDHTTTEVGPLATEGTLMEEQLENAPQKTVLKALQSKIRDLEDRDGFICHVCHGPYTDPVTSISCWHVHCEKCWLQALSSRKLCPQCKSIVSPSELRRIYL